MILRAEWLVLLGRWTDKVPFLTGFTSSPLGNERTSKSTEVCLKAHNDIQVRSSGNGAIICLAGVAFLLVHCIHALSHSLMASLAETTQYWVESSENTWLIAP